MSELVYIDSWAVVGKPGPKDPETPWSTEDLLADMERCGIHGALVSHALAREYDPVYGNRLLLDELRKSERLFGCWVLMPHHTGEMPEADVLVDEMEAHGIRAAKMFPSSHLYDFSEEVCGGIFTALERRRIPLLIESGQALGGRNEASLADIDRLCRAHPQLPVLLQGAKWDSARFVLPLLERHSNLYLEFSSYQSNRGIEFLRDRIGVERLLFGTQWPEKSPGAARAFIDYAQITPEERRAIAGGNLARLLKLEQFPPAYRDRGDEDSIVRAAKAGEPLRQVLVIDAHAHIGHRGAGGGGLIHMPRCGAAGVVERGQMLGIDRVCVSSWLGIWADYERGNEIVHRAMNDFPGQVIGYATIDPNYLRTPEEMMQQVRYCHEELRMPGLKPYYPRVRIPYDDPRYDPWFRYGNDHRLFVLLHPSDNFVPEVRNLAQRYPELTLILAHSGWTWQHARDFVPLAREFDNVYLEITFTTVTHRIIEFLAREATVEKVLFGTDAPMRDPAPQMGWVVYAGISETDKRQILGLNMKRILDRCWTSQSASG